MGSARPEKPRDPVERALAVVIAVLVAKRLGYHLAYLVGDPFALATVSDGQLYEIAARDILACPPFGSEPFYLQGLYAYVLALPMAIVPEVVVGLVLQLGIAALALWLFHRAARDVLGPIAGALSTAVLLAFHELAFYENKYLSVWLGAACNMLALFAAVRILRSPSWPALLGAGAAAGLALLGRPNMAVAIPFTLAAMLVAARAGGVRPPARVVLVFTAGVALALAPMALRNALVVGSPDVLPSHSGAIPFFLGNNPHANGRWNTAGGMVSGQVGRERVELAERLGIESGDRAAVDRAVGDALRERALRYIRERPLDWLALEAKKLWLALGNHRFVRDYDARGEAELIGAFHAIGLPFGVVLGLGGLGLFAMFGRARRARSERAAYSAVLLVLAGQLAAVLAANVLVFTSAQNRMPLGIPLAFAAGPGLLALLSAVRSPRAQEAGGRPRAAWQVSRAALVASALLCVQAFVPRSAGAARPSSVHYFNLATVEEVLGRLDSAAANYARAAERNPKQPLFHLHRARVLRLLGRPLQARAALDALERLPDVPEAVRAAAARERARLRAAPLAR